MENKIKCPCCNREMRVSRVPRLGEESSQIECKNCHISITARDLNYANLLLKTLYRGQWDFEMKCVNGVITYARIGGGYRPI